MLGENKTPFAAIGFEQAHVNGNDMGVIAVRGRYRVERDGSLELLSAQEIVLVDTYAGIPQSTPLVQAADLIPFKPATDVTVLATSYPPNAIAQDVTWLAGVRIEEYKYAVRVFGQRYWERQGKDLRPGSPQLAKPTPIDYRFTWSDLHLEEMPSDPAPYNPVGVRLPNDDIDAVLNAPMALIQAWNDESFNAKNAINTPAGFAPIAPFWRDRQQYAGTYNDDWQNNRHPLLPVDFDYRFYQCAPPQLIMGGFLVGDEEIELFRLHAELESIVFRLPRIQPYAKFQWTDERVVPMRLNLDGVHIDARGTDILVDVTWRGWLPICPSFFRIDLFVAPLGDLVCYEMPFSGIDGLEDVHAVDKVVA
ncbi:DUF2169 family type VI secretion system accessory protein [Phyllobacterium meliloti]|uniref:DUF2169 family type VI secretion system accessory protein n=1 Tax=Phyllobacterium meliloti TaxID=555317 RepID=UPI001D13610B|nr:DUF2169 domain-containing protein [Phyllobacterium sp. T1293]UGX87051.1 DUF2169 domain-containing protein [Phyllobacterium sp. T1293]